MNKAGFMFSESILVSDWNEKRSSSGLLCTRHGAMHFELTILIATLGDWYSYLCYG